MKIKLNAGGASSGPQAPANMTPWIMWYSLLMAVVIYAVVAFVVAPNNQNAGSETPQILTLVLGAVSVSIAAMALFVIPRLAPAMRENARKSRGEDGVKGAFLTYCILRWALVESIAIFGLVIAILSGEPINGMPFIAGSFVLMVLLMPSAGARDRFVGGTTHSGASQSDYKPIEPN
ncbi:MAG: hypothetical protein H6684_13630 [Deltaproteobacteria bacterium]|nr:hypothetical protein [Deltaproteobacteria bacterium]MCB9489768.1 hypothetical protein [Deltaproteobacteria bacterium]